MSILTPSEARILARPIGQFVADNKLQAYIDEVEVTHFAPIFGDPLMLKLQDPQIAVTEPYLTLLKGGTYVVNGNLKAITGLKKAIAYAVYCRLLQSGDVESTRYGNVVKRGEYSEHVSQSVLAKVVGECAEVEQRLTKQCVVYCKAYKLIECRTSGNGIFIGGAQIKKISQ